MQTEGIVRTANASKYLQQLCKHWSHRFPDLTFTPHAGRIPFSADSVCMLEADGEALTMKISAPDDASAQRLQSVVFEHLKRFAFREELPPPEWRAA